MENLSSASSRRIPIWDVAREAGLSKSTVSYALNGHRGIPEAPRILVEETAYEPGYHRNRLARTMARGKNRVFGFLTPPRSLKAEFVGRVLTGVFDGGVPNGDSGVQVSPDDEHDLRLILAHLREPGRRAIAFLSRQARTSVAGWRRAIFARLMNEANLKLPDRWNQVGHWWDIALKARVVRKLLQDPQRQAPLVILPNQLIVRDSTAPPRNDTG